MITQILSLATLTAGASLLLGPPSIEVTTTDQPAGVLATIEAHVHTDADEVRVYGTAYTWSGNQRGERVLRLERVDDSHYRVPDGGTPRGPRVLVLGVEQGVGGEHGAAEALLRIDRAGRVTVSIAKTDPIIGNAMPRRVTDREIENALASIRAE